MNPFTFVRRRPFTTLFLFILLLGCGVFGLTEMRADEIPREDAPKIYVYLDYLAAKAKQARGYIAGQIESIQQGGKGEAEKEEPHKIIATSPKIMDVELTQQYVCQIRSRRHIEICAFDNGYLEEILVQEGQFVKKDAPMFKIKPVLYQARLNAELAEAQLAQLEYNYTKKLSDQKVVSTGDVALHQAKLAKAQAKADLARAELEFTNINAPYDGIVDKLQRQVGSLIKENDVLTTLSDNSVMWVYFNVPEAQYLAYMADSQEEKDSRKIELYLANHAKFPQPGRIATIEAKFNNATGNIPFRADFPNPDKLLRHGQTGTILIKRVQKDAVVIPQRATFENLAKRYVYVIDDEDVVHQREIRVLHELDDIYVIEEGILSEGDKIVLEGIRQVREGDEVEFEFAEPDEILAHQKHKAE
ncbi:MAG: efflux RND transporter periplasmic adaptor subunit [Isosphaeraceae bacterium]